MISPEMSIKPWVCDISGDRLSVQLMKMARRSLKSHRLWWHSSSCLALRLTARSFRRLEVRSVARPAVLQSDPTCQVQWSTPEGRHHGDHRHRAPCNASADGADCDPSD